MKQYRFFYNVGRAVKGLTVTASDETEATRKGLLIAKHRNGDTPTAFNIRLRRA